MELCGSLFIVYSLNGSPIGWIACFETSTFLVMLHIHMVQSHYFDRNRTKLYDSFF